jgi:hypothetical protein
MKGYQHAVAKRVMAWNKCMIRTESGIYAFAQDLQAAGIITIREVQ